MLTRLRVASNNPLAGVGRKKRLQALLVTELYRRFCKTTGYAGGYLFPVSLIPTKQLREKKCLLQSR